MSNVCDVIFWVFSFWALHSPCLIAWMTDFSTAVIEFPMLTNWEDTLFWTDVIFCITLTNFSSIGFLSSLIRLTRVLVALAGWESLFVFDIFNFFLYKDNLKSLTVLIWVCYIQYYNLLSPLLQWYLWVDRGGFLWMIAYKKRVLSRHFYKNIQSHNLF